MVALFAVSSMINTITTVAHITGVMQGEELRRIEWRIEHQLNIVTLEAIDAVHDIGAEPESAERTQELRAAIELSQMITRTRRKLADALRMHADADRLARNIGPDVDAMFDYVNKAAKIHPGHKHFDRVLMAVNQIKTMMGL